MDLTRTIVAKSDQLNADDLMAGPRTFTVREVREGNDDQPVSIFLAEWPGNRPFKPSKTVTRILVHAWGSDSDQWPENARMTLFRDPKVKWAGQEVGGIRVSALSHIGGQLKIALQESKGKKSLHTIDPLPDVPAAPAAPTTTDIHACTDRDTLIGWWHAASPDMQALIQARVTDLDNEPGDA